MKDWITNHYLVLMIAIFIAGKVVDKSYEYLSRKLEEEDLRLNMEKSFYSHHWLSYIPGAVSFLSGVLFTLTFTT